MEPITIGSITGVIISLAISGLACTREPAYGLTGALVAPAIALALTAALVWRHGLNPVIIPALSWVLAATPLAVVDLRSHRLPNWLVALTAAITTCGVAGAVLWQERPGIAGWALAGSAVLLGFYVLLFVIAPNQLGGGDVKLAAVAGAVLGSSGWTAIVAGLLAIWLLSALAMLTTAVITRSRTQGLPHGPWLVLGTLAPALLGLQG